MVEIALSKTSSLKTHSSQRTLEPFLILISASQYSRLIRVHCELRFNCQLYQDCLCSATLTVNAIHSALTLFDHAIPDELIKTPQKVVLRTVHTRGIENPRDALPSFGRSLKSGLFSFVRRIPGIVSQSRQIITSNLPCPLLQKSSSRCPLGAACSKNYISQTFPSLLA